MNIEEKIAHLQMASMEEARAEGNAIIEQYTNSLEEVFETHRQEAFRQSETRIAAEEINLKQQLNMAVSRGQIEWKREKNNVQTRLKKQLFEEVHNLLNDYMKTEAYDKLLVSYIKKAAGYAAGEEQILYINKSDLDKKEDLEKETGLTLMVSDKDFVGGIRSLIEKRNMLIDYSFKTLLEEEYESFIFGGGGRIE